MRHNGLSERLQLWDRPDVVTPRRDTASDLALLAILLIWVASFIVFKLAFHQFRPMAFNLLRFLLMIPLAFATLWFAERDLSLPRGIVGRLVLSSLLGHGMYQIFFVAGLARTSAAATALLLSMTPIFSVLLLRALRLERLSWAQWIGVFVALGGVALFVQGRPGLGWQVRTGDLFAVAASACFASYGVINKTVLTDITPVRLMAYGLFIGLIPIVPFSIPDALAQDWGAINLSGWLLLLYSTVCPVYLAYLLWNWAIARQGVSRTVPVSYLVPVLTGVAAHLLLGESLTVPQMVGGAIVLGGVALARRSPVAPDDSSEPIPAK